jgi:HD-GYP domain-containing protein (c-di-GMP phosphodiesterase class II)
MAPRARKKELSLTDWTADNSSAWLHSTAKTLMEALRMRDPYTYGHCMRVGRNGRLLAEAMGLNEFEQRIVEFSSMFHDIGKIWIPDAVLYKPGKLNPEEEKIMQRHPEKSVEILAPLEHVPFFRATLPGIRPHGLAGEQIPLYSRIILVVDTFDAMTTTRSYRKGLPIETAYKELLTFSGRQFDEQVVKIFLDAHKSWDPIEKEISEEFVKKSA